MYHGRPVFHLPSDAFGACRRASRSQTLQAQPPSLSALSLAPKALYGLPFTPSCLEAGRQHQRHFFCETFLLPERKVEKSLNLLLQYLSPQTLLLTEILFCLRAFSLLKKKGRLRCSYLHQNKQTPPSRLVSPPRQTNPFDAPFPHAPPTKKRILSDALFRIQSIIDDSKTSANSLPSRLTPSTIFSSLIVE